MALNRRQEPAAAEAALRRAVALRPDYAFAYDNLGSALAAQRKHGEAEAAHRKAIALQPDFAFAYFNLAYALVEQAHFEEGLAYVMKGNRLLPARSPFHEQTESMREQCQRYIVLDARLPAVLQGKDQAASALELVEFAHLCLRKKLYAAASRFFGDAFAADPNVTQSPSVDNLYDAGRAAAQAGCRQGQDGPKREDKECARWRRQALDWLRQDLKRLSEALDRDPAAAREGVRQQLSRWRADPDLAGLREPAELEKLSAAERKDCHALWAEAGALIDRCTRRADTLPRYNVSAPNAA
jgi:serine/threonine-protein kinase